MHISWICFLNLSSWPASFCACKHSLFFLQSLDELDDDDAGEKDRREEEELVQANTFQNEAMTADPATGHLMVRADMSRPRMFFLFFVVFPPHFSWVELRLMQPLCQTEALLLREKAGQLSVKSSRNQRCLYISSSLWNKFHDQQQHTKKLWKLHVHDDIELYLLLKHLWM